MRTMAMKKLTTNLEDIAYIEKEILSDPSVSHWLKRLIEESSNRDILDAINDINILRSILNLRHEAMKENN